MIRAVISAATWSAFLRNLTEAFRGKSGKMRSISATMRRARLALMAAFHYRLVNRLAASTNTNSK